MQTANSGAHHWTLKWSDSLFANKQFGVVAALCTCIPDVASTKPVRFALYPEAVYGVPHYSAQQCWDGTFTYTPISTFQILVYSPLSMILPSQSTLCNIWIWDNIRFSQSVSHVLRINILSSCPLGHATTLLLWCRFLTYIWIISVITKQLINLRDMRFSRRWIFKSPSSRLWHRVVGTEDGGSKVLRIVCIPPHHYMASYPRRPRLRLFNLFINCFEIVKYSHVP
jgi:hypothetical protein